jgi:hypothetical protein
MSKTLGNLLEVELLTVAQRAQLVRVARERNWGLALMLIGWLHLAAFSICYYLTIVRDYHKADIYLTIWISELFGMWLIFRCCGGSRRADQPTGAPELFIRRVWIAYFLLAFNLGSLNTLRGHHLFELFPAMASLASFALILMSIVLDWRFFVAVLVMFGSGLLMAAHLLHAFLIFAVAWWAVLNGIGLTLLASRSGGQEPSETRCTAIGCSGVAATRESESQLPV